MTMLLSEVVQGKFFDKHTLILLDFISVSLCRGLTVANRLTEDPSVTVAVIEAGFYAENLPEVCY